MGKLVGKPSDWLRVVPPCETTAGAHRLTDKHILSRHIMAFTMGDILIILIFRYRYPHK